jgi:Zn-dependent protease/predicted transcriptional regulator
MKWSLRLGRFLGIDVYLHFTFLVFLALVWYLTRESFTTLAFFVAAFTCVTLHEYGHALTARKFGIGTHDITLLPIGGVARLEKMPDRPFHELLVAIAGPAVNLVIAVVLYLICRATGTDPLLGVDEIIRGRRDLLVTLMWWNVTMIIFNMLPAFPMDGGRVLRAILAMNMNYAKATRWAANVGKVMALIFAYYAIFHVGHIMLIIIAFFVWSGASQEAAMAEQKVALDGVFVRDAMITDFRRVSPEETSGTMAQLILQGWQTDFPVTYDGQVVGLVTWQDVIAGLNVSHTVVVSSFMRHPVPSCLPGEKLEDVLERMKMDGLPLLPVVEEGRLLGLVTPENTVEFMAIRRALDRRV